MTIEITQDHNDYRLAGTLAYADLGTGHSKIQLFATTQPALGASAGGSPLVEITLADPCGAVTAHVLSLVQADLTGDLISTTGIALWGRWFNANGDIVGDGDVSDSAGSGFFKVAGTTGTTLYAGARAILGTVSLG